MIKNTLLLLLLFVNYEVFCQNNFHRDTTVIVNENGVLFKNAWAGGLNSTQFNDIDLDLDGKKDLIVFDKSGDKILPYLNKNGQFVFAPDYRQSFPDLHDWVILADYNCDGKNDIYTYSTGGVAIYENTSTTSLSFNLVTNLVLSDYGGPNPINIYISAVDVPAVSDVDYD